MFIVTTVEMVTDVHSDYCRDGYGCSVTTVEMVWMFIVTIVEIVMDVHSDYCRDGYVCS